MLKSHVMFICLLVISVSIYAKTADITLETLTDVCTALENAITDITAEYDFEISGPDTEKIQEGDLKWIGPQKNVWSVAKPFNERYKSIQVQILEDTRENAFELHRSEAYNGSIYKEFQKSDNNKSPSGVIAGGHAGMQEYNLTPLGFTIFHRAYDLEPLLDILQGRYDYYTLKLDPNISEAGDFKAAEIVCIAHNKSKNLTFKAMSMFFSIEHNFTLVKIVYYNGNKIASIYKVTQLKDMGNGIWFPLEAVTFGSGDVINTLKISNVQINKGLEDKDFDLEFPPGTRVKDKVTGKKYTVRPTQEQIDQASN